jgi:hypothetical protein
MADYNSYESFSEEFYQLIDLVEQMESHVEEINLYVNFSEEELIEFVRVNREDQIPFLALIKKINELTNLDYLKSRNIASNWTK